MPALAHRRNSLTIQACLFLLTEGIHLPSKHAYSCSQKEFTYHPSMPVLAHRRNSLTIQACLFLLTEGIHLPSKHACSCSQKEFTYHPSMPVLAHRRNSLTIQACLFLLTEFPSCTRRTDTDKTVHSIKTTTSLETRSRRTVIDITITFLA